MEQICQLKRRTVQDTLHWEGEAVLCLHSDLPEVSALEARAQRRINRFYERLEGLFLRRCRRSLLPRSAEELRRQRSCSRPFTPWEAGLTCRTEQREQLLEVTVRYRLLRPEGDLLREQTHLWDLSTGFPVKNGQK